MDHGTLQQLAAGAALDDLDAAERASLDAHLASCTACTSLTSELDGVLADLAFAAPQMHPPPSLKDEVMSALRAPVVVEFETPTPLLVRSRAATDQAQGGATTAAPAIHPAERRRWRAVGLAGAGMAAVLTFAAAGLASRVAELDGQMAAARVLLAEAQADVAAPNAALALIATANHVTAALRTEPIARGATAMVVFQPGSAESYLMATGLPATPEGQVYQLWYADDAGVHALGTFHHEGGGPFVAPFGVDLGSSAAAMLTLEADGGAKGEPGPQVVFGEF